MKRNEIVRCHEKVYRILDISENLILVLDCLRLTMPKWVDASLIMDSDVITEDDLCGIAGYNLPHVGELTPADKAIAHRRFTMISGIIPVIGDKNRRSSEIRSTSEQNSISKQSIRKYLCMYLAYQSIVVLAPRNTIHERELTQDEKNMRWGLNKFYYTKNKSSLNSAYTMLIKEKYTDANGKLLPEYPSFYQFRYFFRKTRKLQTQYISRNGLKDYQRNSRPLTGDGVTEYANHVGLAMMDSTIFAMLKDTPFCPYEDIATYEHE